MSSAIFDQCIITFKHKQLLKVAGFLQILIDFLRNFAFNKDTQNRIMIQFRVSLAV